VLAFPDLDIPCMSNGAMHVWRQRWQGKWIMNFMVAYVLMSWYVDWKKCSGYIMAWLGIFPLEVMVTGAMVGTS
jgi:hypothetical protein